MTATPTFLPIACSLAADVADARQADWRALLSRALISRSSVRDGVRIELQKLQRLAVTAPELAAPILHQMLAGDG